VDSCSSLEIHPIQFSTNSDDCVYGTASKRPAGLPPNSFMENGVSTIINVLKIGSSLDQVPHQIEFHREVFLSMVNTRQFASYKQMQG
jgi:hypothetical protein